MTIRPQDHPDFVGGWVWSAIEIRWIEERIRAEIEALIADNSELLKSLNAEASERMRLEDVVHGAWISVDDRVPPENVEVLVCSQEDWETTPSIKIDTWSMQRESPVSFSSVTIPTGYDWDRNDRVTHWQPMPDAPAAVQHEIGVESDGGETD